MAGTIFEHSSTSLRKWFYAMYLMGSTRCGISAKQIQRETGVTYKTAWRMFKQIRSLLSEPDMQLEGSTVEMDETYMGGPRRGPRAGVRPLADKQKTCADRNCRAWKCETAKGSVIAVTRRCQLPAPISTGLRKSGYFPSPPYSPMNCTVLTMDWTRSMATSTTASITALACMWLATFTPTPSKDSGESGKAWDRRSLPRSFAEVFADLLG